MYLSSKTRDWFGREDPQRYFRSFTRMHRVLVESHIQVGFLFDENVTIERLKQFPLLYLANTAIITTAEVDMFRRYVAEGGILIATLDTGRFDEHGNPRKDFALGDLLGVRFVGKTEFSANFFRMPETFAKDFEPNYDIFLSGPSNVVEAKKESSFGELKIAFHDRDGHTHIGHAPNNSP